MVQLKLSIAAVLIVAGSAGAQSRPPARTDYVLAKPWHTVNLNPTSQRMPNDRVILITLDTTRYKTREEYIREIRDNARPLVDSDAYEVIGLTQIAGEEAGDKPCRMKLTLSNLDKVAAGTQIGPPPFNGTEFLDCGSGSPGSRKVTPALAEDEFITGTQICQNFNALTDNTNRFKGLRLKVRKLLPDGPESRRSNLGPARISAGFERTRCSGTFEGRPFEECQDNQIAVGLEIFFSPAADNKPSAINMIMPVCADVISKQSLRNQAARR